MVKDEAEFKEYEEKKLKVMEDKRLEEEEAERKMKADEEERERAKKEEEEKREEHEISEKLEREAKVNSDKRSPTMTTAAAALESPKEEFLTPEQNRDDAAAIAMSVQPSRVKFNDL